jgi:hypothetical protein
MSYKDKYLKYKNKYFNLIEQFGLGNRYQLNAEIEQAYQERERAKRAKLLAEVREKAIRRYNEQQAYERDMIEHYGLSYLELPIYRMSLDEQIEAQIRRLPQVLQQDVRQAIREEQEAIQH